MYCFGVLKEIKEKNIAGILSNKNPYLQLISIGDVW